MARHYQTLDSEKYLTAQMGSARRRRANVSVAGLFANVLIVMVAVAACFYAIRTMPEWLPTAEATFHQYTRYRYM